MTSSLYASLASQVTRKLAGAKHGALPVLRALPVPRSHSSLHSTTASHHSIPKLGSMDSTAPSGATPTAAEPLFTDGATHSYYLDIDGSILEGGGQILRITAALAAIGRIPVKVDRIRLGRAKPGLKAQHLTGLQLVARLCDGKLTGGAVNSTSITFNPSKLQAGHHVADTGTAGSCTLMMQASLPCLLFAPPAGDNPPTSTVELRGGTDADMAPPVGYLQHVLVPLLRRLVKIQVDVDLVKRGFYPRGGGVVKVAATCLPPNEPLPAFDLTERGKVTRITIRAFTAGKVPRKAGERMAAAAKKVLRNGTCEEEERPDIVVETVHDTKGFGSATGISVVVETDTGCVLGATAQGVRDVPDEATGEAVGEEMLQAMNSGSCVDQWMQDQLIIFMALASGTSRMLAGELSLHTQTAMVICEKLLPDAKFSVTEQRVEGRNEPLFLVECKGAGVTRT